VCVRWGLHLCRRGLHVCQMGCGGVSDEVCTHAGRPWGSPKSLAGKLLRSSHQFHHFGGQFRLLFRFTIIAERIIPMIREAYAEDIAKCEGGNCHSGAARSGSGWDRKAALKRTHSKR
jgi:hypothetical protein